MTFGRRVLSGRTAKSSNQAGALAGRDEREQQFNTRNTGDAIARRPAHFDQCASGVERRRPLTDGD